MKNFFRISIFGVLMSLVLSACQMASNSQAAGLTTTQPAVTLSVTSKIAATATATPAPTKTMAVATLPSDTAKAEQAAKSYFDSLAAGDFKQASAQVSDFSLAVFSLSRGDVASQLSDQATKGKSWSGFEIEDSQVFSSSTILVHVSFMQDGKSGKADEEWPFRLEKGMWRYNWNNLIDFKTLVTDEQAINKITMKPMQILRYSDHLELGLLVQNRSDETIVFGQQNEILATFHFGDKVVEANQKQLVFSRLQSYPNATIEVKGLFTTYPDSVEIRKWKNLQVKPWYTFDF